VGRIRAARVQGDMGQYMDGLRKKNTLVATRKQHLAEIRPFFGRTRSTRNIAERISI